MRTRTSINDKCETGFTLFELLVVLALVALMAGIATSGRRGMSPSFALKMAEDQLVADIRRMQTTARVSSTPQTIKWSASSYTLSGPSAQSIGLSRGIVLNSSVPILTVFPDGYADGVKITLSLGDRQRIISVNPFSGNVVRHAM